MNELDYLRTAFRGQNHQQLRLSVDMARHLTSRPTAQADGNALAEPTPHKKRKLESPSTDHGSRNPPIPSTLNTTSAPPILSIPDVSFTVPVRKKLSLTLYRGTAGGLRVTSKDAVTVHDIPWSSVARVFCLPVPDRPTRQHNFVVVLDGEEAGERQFVFALGEVDYVGTCVEAREGDTWVSLLGRLVNVELIGLGRLGIELPSEEEFRAEAMQSAWGQKGWSVKAHLGSKDGIVFGFRKPVCFFPFAVIQSISYTSVLQRTFNLVITISPGSSERHSGSTVSGRDTDQVREEEFSMLDQADFAGIDAYVKKHGLNDSSMAVERMAKRIGVNDSKRKRRHGEDDGDEQTSGAVDGEEEEGELAKAERELQDEEDEEEEDYDPGSEGESEGEGDDSEGEDDGGGVGNGEAADEL